MKSHWTLAALLSSALVIACNGRNNDNSQNPDQNPPAATQNAPAANDQTLSPAPPVQSGQSYSPEDRSPALPAPSPAPKVTAGRREAVVPRAASTPPDVNLPTAESSRVAASPAPRAPEWREITVPAGTELALEMTSAVSSATARVETPVTARLQNAVVINGNTAIPAGATLSGTVTDVERSGRVQGRAHVAMTFTQVRTRSEREDVRTNPVTFEAEATKGEDATKVGVGAVGGAILGGILGGKKGAGKGAVGGAAAGGAVVAATRGKEVVVAEGTSVVATLAQPLTLRVPIR